MKEKIGLRIINKIKNSAAPKISFDARSQYWSREAARISDRKAKYIRAIENMTMTLNLLYFSSLYGQNTIKIVTATITNKVVIGI